MKVTRTDLVKKQHVGVFVLDGMKFDLVIVPGSAGSFYWPTSPRSFRDRPECEIGGDVGGWHEIVKILLHELTEAAFMERQCLFERTKWLTDNSSGRHIMHCDHAQFSEIMDAVGDVLTYSMPALLAAWKKWGTHKQNRLTIPGEEDSV